jgi:two-component system, NtrC family, phosphoglycerate transport system response regulator PgtA
MASLSVEPDNAPETRLHANGRVLLVDEDRNDLNSYFKLLDQAGYAVQPSTSYVDAYCRLGAEPYDFIIANQGSDGLEWKAVVERAREVPQHPPVLVMTRCHDMSSYRQAMELGAVDYLEKPVKPADLINLVQTHLAGEGRA